MINNTSPLIIIQSTELLLIHIFHQHKFKGLNYKQVDTVPFVPHPHAGSMYVSEEDMDVRQTCGRVRNSLLGNWMYGDLQKKDCFYSTDLLASTR